MYGFPEEYTVIYHRLLAYLARLRIYPMPFARHLIDLLDDMKATAAGRPVPPVDVPSALQSFSQWPEMIPGDWQFVDLAELYNYLRGNRNLQIPQQWRGTIPDRLGDAP